MIRLLRSNLSRMVLSKSFLIYLGMYALYSIALPILFILIILLFSKRRERNRCWR